MKFAIAFLITSNMNFSLPLLVSRSATHFSQLISQIVQKKPKSVLSTGHSEVRNEVQLERFRTKRTEPTEKIQTGVLLSGSSTIVFTTGDPTTQYDNYENFSHYTYHNVC